MKSTMLSIISAIAAAGLAVPAGAQLSAALPSTTATPSATFDVSAYQYDDGTAENALGLTAGGQMCWLQQYTAAGGSAVINSVSTAVGFPTGAFPAAGTALTVYVWDDPNNDGNPTDVVLLGSASGVVAAPGTNTITTYTLGSPIVVSGTFFVGAMCAHAPGEFPGPMDQSQASAGRAWVVGSTTSTFDATDLTNNDVTPLDIDTIGFPAVWLLRAESDPFSDLGNGLAGAGGTPLLEGTGSLVPGTAMSLELSGAAAGASAALVVGDNPLFGSFKGGVMVPDPLVIFLGLTTDGAGAISMGGTWPLGAASGRTTYFQYWIVDAGGPWGYAASNGLGGTTP